MIKLTIITINLNNASGLRKTIESVINQTLNDFEYIVIDGGSTDQSVEVIKEYESKISYWISEPDTGIYNAMNKGIMKAKGEYCQFLNSGDYLVSNSVIETMILNLPVCSVFYGNMLKLLPNNRIHRDKKVNTNSMLTHYKGALNHSPAFIKRDLFDKYGLYDEELRIVSDWKFYLTTIGLNNEPVKYIDLDVTYFDMNGISNTNTDLDRKERRQVLENLLPANVLNDYDNYSLFIYQMKRIKKYKFIYWAVWLIERVLFKFEKWGNKNYGKLFHE